MSTFRPLFATSTARSGSYLISMMLSANPAVTIASEPYLELFRSYRNAALRHDGRPEVLAAVPPESPMQDYQFSAERLQAMHAVQESDLWLPFDPDEWDGFLERSAPRAELQCAELAPGLPSLRGDTYRDMFDAGLRLIAETRDAADRRWIGIKDAWCIEFFAPLARAYPDARFLVILRDPRAVVSSMLGVVNIDDSQLGQPLSYVRHWRKYVAFVSRYLEDPLFAGRLAVVTHEEVLADPEGAARRLSDFLDVDYHPDMIDTSTYRDHATGGIWTGNSSFETTTVGISTHRAERWRTALPEETRRLVDFLAAPDLLAAGYEPIEDFRGVGPDDEVIAALMEGHAGYANWRSDLGDPLADLGAELVRRALLDLDVPPEDLLLQSFLFHEAHLRVRRAWHGEAAPLAPPMAATG